MYLAHFTIHVPFNIYAFFKAALQYNKIKVFFAKKCKKEEDVSV